jgi:hypothetical protein
VTCHCGRGCKERTIFILAVLVSPKAWLAMPTATVARKVKEIGIEKL